MKLGNVIIRDLDVDRTALLCAVGHGQVFLDGVCLTREDLNMAISDATPGAMVKLHSRLARVNGTRIVSITENAQLELS